MVLAIAAVSAAKIAKVTTCHQARWLNASKGNCVTGTIAYDEQSSNRAATSAQHVVEEAISASVSSIRAHQLANLY